MSGWGLLFFKVLARPLAFVRFSSKRPSGKPLLFVAHRGASQLAPENSLSAFKIALDSHVDMIELDVHLSADGVPIVIHDSNFFRTTGVDAQVGKETLAHIKDLTISENGETVPTLDEVLQLAGGRKKILIELKSPKHRIYTDIVDRVMQCVKRNQAEKWIILQSFEPVYLQKICSDYPKIECHQLIEGTAAPLPLYYDVRLRWNLFKPVKGVKAVNLNYRYLSDDFIRKCKHHGLKVFVYTPNDAASVAKCSTFDVDGVITDNLSLVSKKSE